MKIEGHWDVLKCPGGYWSMVPTQLGWHHKTSAWFSAVTVSASVLVAGTDQGWNLLVQWLGTMPTTPVCWAGHRQGTLKLFYPIAHLLTFPLSWAAIGAISAPIPTPLISFSLNGCLWRGKTSHEHLFSCLKAKCQSASACPSSPTIPVWPARLLGVSKEREEPAQLKAGNCLQQTNRCLWFMSTFPKGLC